MRILFAGTPDAAVPSLRALADSHHDIAAVLTRPDAPVGRKRVLTPSPVKSAALELGLDVLEASRLRGDILTAIEQLDLDAVAVVAYGALAGSRALAASKLGWFNLHFSLLPDYRGAAPVQRALMDGISESGVTVFKLDEGMDTGDIVLARPYPLPHHTAGEVLDDYALRGAPVLLEALGAVEAGTAVLTPQPEHGTHAAKITPQQAQLDFAQPATVLAAIARGTTPSPGPWATMGSQRTKVLGVSEAPAGLGDGQTLAPGQLALIDGRVLAGTGAGLLTIERIQPFGKPMMAAADFLRGRPQARFDHLDTAANHEGGVHA